MENDPELNGKYLGTITNDFILVAETLREAAYQVRKRNISQYPVFAISHERLPIGQLLIGRGEMAAAWNYYASFLEEFVERRIVEDIELFRTAWKDPDEFCCLFVVDQEFTNFVFIPYPED